LTVNQGATSGYQFLNTDITDVFKQQAGQHKDQHIRALDQTRTVLQAAASRAEETDVVRQREHERTVQLETDLVEMKGDIEV
jgi:hypothetical protein